MSSQVTLAITIGISILIYILACHGVVYYRLHPQTAFVVWLARTICRPHPGNWLYQVARFAYYVGIPYVALRQGIASAQMMGLGEWNGKFEDVLISIGLSGTAVVLFALAWSARVHSLALPEMPISSRKRHWLMATLDILYLEVHWAFYRSGPILWLGGDYYAGSILGLALIWTEGLFDPALRAGLRRPETSLRIAISWGTSLCMTMVFFFSRSLWIVIPAHWLVAACSGEIRRMIDSKRASDINDHFHDGS